MIDFTFFERRDLRDIRIEGGKRTKFGKEIENNLEKKTPMVNAFCLLKKKVFLSFFNAANLNWESIVSIQQSLVSNWLIRF